MSGELVKIIAIPDDCRAIVVGNNIEIYKRISHRLIDTELRCKDCVHRIDGYTTYRRWYISKVCELKPKKLPNYAAKDVLQHPEKYITLYYGCNAYAKICDNFKKKE